MSRRTLKSWTLAWATPTRHRNWLTTNLPLGRLALPGWSTFKDGLWLSVLRRPRDGGGPTLCREAQDLQRYAGKWEEVGVRFYWKHVDSTNDIKWLEMVWKDWNGNMWLSLRSLPGVTSGAAGWSCLPWFAGSQAVFREDLKIHRSSKQICDLRAQVDIFPLRTRTPRPCTGKFWTQTIRQFQSICFCFNFNWVIFQHICFIKHKFQFQPCCFFLKIRLNKTISEKYHVSTRSSTQFGPPRCASRPRSSSRTVPEISSDGCWMWTLRRATPSARSGHIPGEPAEFWCHLSWIPKLGSLPSHKSCK